MFREDIAPQPEHLYYFAPHIEADGRKTQLSPTGRQEAIALMETNIRKQQLEFGKSYGEPANIDIPRIRFFFHALGSALPAYVAVGRIPEEDEVQHEPNYVQELFQDFRAEPKLHGQRLSEMRLAVIRNVPGLTIGEREHVAVHEFSHTSAPYSYRLTYSLTENHLSLEPQRAGFVTGTEKGDSGHWFEEAEAEWKGGNYSKLTGQIPAGAGYCFQERGFELPAKYAFNERGRFSPSAFAAVGLELLGARNPAIFETMLKARRNLTGTGELMQRIEAMSPGLYSHLTMYPQGEEGHLEGLQKIIDTLYDGDKTVTRTVGEIASDQFFAGKMAAHEQRTGRTLMLPTLSRQIRARILGLAKM